MATRKTRGGGATSGAAVEIEIERAREEGNWKRVIELAEQLKLRPEKQCETLGNFLIGEAKLEDFLEEYPPKEKNASKAKEGLGESREHLMKTTGDEAKKLGVHLDSYILLGKLNYAMSNYGDALRFYDKAQLDTLEEKQLPARSLKIMAEAFAIKALCYEKVSHKSSSKAKIAEKEATIVKCYEIAGDLTLLFLQVADKSNLVASSWSVAGTSSSPIPPHSSSHKLGPILEMALLKAPALNLKAGQNMKAINRFRAMLQAEESESTKEIRRNVCWKLAEVLLHGISDVSYVKPTPASDSSQGPFKRPPSTNPPPPSSSSSSARIANAAIDSPWKPRKHAGSNLYAPKTKNEEIVLLLLLSESMARKEAILSQAPEFFGMRSTKFRDAIITYDLTAIALSRIRSFRILADMLENSMKFSFNEPHTWTQFGLALASEGMSFRALTVLRELAERNQADAGTCLAASRLCYERLSFYEEGLEWARRAMKKDSSSHDQFLKARCNIFLGIGCMLKVKTLENHSERQEFQTLAKDHFLEAHRSDGMDHLAEFYLAVHFARSRVTTVATQHVRRALDLHPDHLPSLHLLILLLSAKGEYAEALEVADLTLEEFPDNLSIMSLKVRLEEKVNGSEAAILMAKEMLIKWQQACDGRLSTDDADHPNSNSANAATGSSSAPAASAASGNPSNAAAFDTLSDKDSISLHAHSVTASHVEKTLSEVASSVSSPFPRPGLHDPAYTQMRIWLLSAELHLNAGNLFEAEQCLLEARALAPLSYHLMYARGLICEKKGELETAKQCYENSLGVNPSHVSSLHRLGRVYCLLGYHRLSEQALKVAARIDPTNEEVWTLLGEVKEAIARETLMQVDDDEEVSMQHLEESEKTPTEATKQSIMDEAARMFRRAAECQAIALSLQSSSPILPFSTIPLCFE